MKKIINYIKRISFLAFSMILPLLMYAKNPVESATDPTIANHEAIYMQFWFWMIVGVVFLFVIVLMLRGEGNKQQ